MQKAIKSFVAAIAQGAERAAVFIGAGDSTTWHQENEERRIELR
jgi:hypothetical protein